MTSHLGTSLATASALLALACLETPAIAAELPAIKTTDQNAVPECVTPGRLMSYVKSRNEKLDPKFEEVATDYMRHGEELGLRWDYAFFQMLLETNTLKYTGDVKVTQNNFAGLGATGHGARGESFKTVSDGVRAHLQHVQMYSGEKVENPVAERTRNIQEWGVLTKWQATIKSPMTYSQLAKQWAPTSRGYSKDVETLAGLYFNGACKDADPHPELVQEARAGRDGVKAVDASGEAAPAGKGAEIAKKAIAEARAEGKERSGLGAANLAKAAATTETAGASAATSNSPPVKVLNSTAASSDADESAPAKSVAAAAKPAADKSDKPATASEKGAKIETAALSAPLLGQAPPASTEAKSDAKCRVFTASYGGDKAIIIKAVADAMTNYTVLDVNDGAEKREADAYIGAYAKGGESVGEFATQDKALEKAFELCPEG